ncbi:hypothetical protein WOLCODRAFT_21717 [Wolfiporia cocos MD-104 SS10]|uniref:Uncharacterized protein n=1 Tax=Wolfiporia cocos (strain MD-104) TaxID=742152 RepID=A0A2H3ISW4_WOLCO|nr:hypothetical protein WOLCODRAFT_21717 [Wolfiporia cocos MD-104 SS10]
MVSDGCDIIAWLRGVVRFTKNGTESSFGGITVNVTSGGRARPKRAGASTTAMPALASAAPLGATPALGWHLACAWG